MFFKDECFVGDVVFLSVGPCDSAKFVADRILEVESQDEGKGGLDVLVLREYLVLG